MEGNRLGWWCSHHPASRYVLCHFPPPSCIDPASADSSPNDDDDTTASDGRCPLDDSFDERIVDETRSTIASSTILVRRARRRDSFDERIVDELIRRVRRR
jgi:hypothetical protein